MPNGGEVVAWRFDGLIRDLATGERVAATVEFCAERDGAFAAVIDCRGQRRTYRATRLPEFVAFARACYFPGSTGDGDGAEAEAEPASITNLDGTPALTVVQETRRRVRLRRSLADLADAAASVAAMALAMGRVCG